MGEGKGTAIVTGASSGLGAAFARALAARGHDLLLVARREERLRAVTAELAGRVDVAAEALVADLSREVDLARVEARIAQLDRIDLLVNNAGFGTWGTFAAVELARHLAMIQVHVVASVRLTHAVLPRMLARGRGGIINVSSIGAFLPGPDNVTYGATKAYLLAFSEALRGELRGSGVRVQALCPGFTSTEFHDAPDYAWFDRSVVPRFLWMSAEEVVAASLRAMDADRGRCIPDWSNRLIVALAETKPGRVLLQRGFVSVTGNSRRLRARREAYQVGASREVRERG
jgi:short-subunit dehydrogenase